MSAKVKDSKYFNPSKKGELHELKQELDTGAIEAKRDCLKKIIAAMTIGKDVSVLFPDVVKQINTQDLELKKLVYLYVMNYAKSQPNLAILSVNAFVQDSTKNKNPLIRALAIRTMGCIRVEQITEYLCQPLQLCLKDEDPYVRKTAAVCVAKLYDISPSLVEAQGFLELLVDLLSDANPMVVSNAVAALSEIAETSPDAFRVTPHTLSKLLAALNECSEWGQIFILNALAAYDPKDSREAEGIAERVTARLQHNNSAVVLGAIRVLMKYLDAIRSAEAIRTLTKKMGAPLVTLLSKEPELQYVALRNIILILQKRPTVLQHELKVFFCKYNDPLYVKMEKLEIMIMLVNERNVDQVLMELKEYATAADVEFVRKAVAAIGHTAIKLERAAERCIHVLLELIENGYNPVVQEAMIVIKDIFRKYPDQYESIIHKLCDNLELDEPGARAAMMWILGEYAERIDNAEDLLYGFLQNFLDEPYKVQLQLLTATVKLFLKRPKNAKDMVLRVLHLAAEECSNPDIRDRGFMYWRLLTNPKAAKAVVLTKRPQIAEASSLLDPGVLDLLVAQISTLSAVYHQPPETFVPKLRRGQAQQAAERLKQLKEQNRAQTDDGGVEDGSEERGESLLGDILTGDALVTSSSSSSNAAGERSILELLGDSPATPPVSSSGSSLNELLGGGSEAAAFAPVHHQQHSAKVLLPAAQGSGLQISGRATRDSSSPAGIRFEFVFENLGATPLSNFAIQFNTNTFGIVPAAPLQVQPLQPGQSAQTVLPLAFNGAHRSAPETPPSSVIQIAVKDNRGPIFYFAETVPFELLFSADGNLEAPVFLQSWGELAATERSFTLPITSPVNLTQIQERLSHANIFTVARRALADREVFYCAAKVAQVGLLFEIAFPSDMRSVVANARSRAAPFLLLVQDVIQRLVA